MISHFIDRSHWNLFIALSKRDIAQRYRGSLLGFLWALIAPLLMLTVYAFVFRVVFQTRWPVSSVPLTNPADRPAPIVDLIQKLPEGLGFAFNLFIGLIVFSAFSEAIAKAPRLVLDHPQLVRRVVFPLPLLGFVLAATSLFQALMQWIVMIVVMIATLLFLLISASATSLDTILGLSFWFLSAVPTALCILFCMVPVLLGISWLLAALGTYFRDLQHATPALMSILMFLGPVFYPISALPEQFRDWAHLNPITLIAEEIRLVLLFGGEPDRGALALYVCIGSLFAMAAYALFSRVRRGFADVL